MQFWPPDDKHMCSKHVEARYKLILKLKYCASSSLITKINILRCTVSKTSIFIIYLLVTNQITNELVFRSSCVHIQCHLHCTNLLIFETVSPSFHMDSTAIIKSRRLSRKVHSVWSISFVSHVARLQSKCEKRLLALSSLSVSPFVTTRLQNKWIFVKFYTGDLLIKNLPFP